EPAVLPRARRARTEQLGLPRLALYARGNPPGSERQRHQLVREDDLAAIGLPDVANAFLHRAGARQVRTDMDEDKAFDAGLLRHPRSAHRTALAADLAHRFHSFLIVPTHAEHHVGIAREVHHARTRLGVAGEHHTALGTFQPIGQGIEERLEV